MLKAAVSLIPSHQHSATGPVGLGTDELGVEDNRSKNIACCPELNQITGDTPLRSPPQATSLLSGNDESFGTPASVPPPLPAKTTKNAVVSVRFCGLVRVCLIPHRSAYSSHVRSRLWASRHEIHKNAVRNTLEYAYEGWDVTGVVEDDRMVLCEGRRVHPIHFVPPDIRKHYLATCRRTRGRQGCKATKVLQL